MNCPNCGADLPEGSTFCSVCQAPINGAATSPVNDALFNAAPTYAAGSAKKKAPVVGIVIGVIVALAALFCIGFFVLGGKHNGTYYLESMSYFGETLSASDLGMDGVGLKVSFGKCEFVGAEDLIGETGRSKIKFSGDEVTITDADGTTISGEVDGDSLILDASGVEMIFTK